ncbi:DNA-3-methyladenine glycosylase family protein [Nonomuraea typhae]|uniref:DNA-3-methyladenine glycosylase family protein n=1 Tax=Nonomuraea typhae TaxID=2603600 RepID=A0ABW7YMR7_9ACTN
MTWTMLDHPAWDLASAPPARAARTSSGTWLLTAPEYTVTLVAGGGSPPTVDVYEASRLDDSLLPPGLAQALRSLGHVQRVRTADLWEALATAIVRTVIQAKQARRMHRAFRDAVGQPVGAQALTPTAKQVLALDEEEFTALGMAFKRAPLQAAAHAYLTHQARWAQLPPDVLIKELQTVPGIGPWTAGAAVADHTGNFAFYPYADLAVRTWAKQADPATTWPADERSFAATWRLLGGPHLSVLTVLTLAWGDHHARSDQGSKHR